MFVQNDIAWICSKISFWFRLGFPWAYAKLGTKFEENYCRSIDFMQYVTFDVVFGTTDRRRALSHLKVHFPCMHHMQKLKLHQTISSITSWSACLVHLWCTLEYKCWVLIVPKGKFFSTAPYSSDRGNKQTDNYKKPFVQGSYGSRNRLFPKRALLHLSALYLRPEGRWVFSGCVMSCPIEIATRVMALLFSSVKMGVRRPVIFVAVVLTPVKNKVKLHVTCCKRWNIKAQ